MTFILSKPYNNSMSSEIPQVGLEEARMYPYLKEVESLFPKDHPLKYNFVSKGPSTKVQ